MNHNDVVAETKKFRKLIGTELIVNDANGSQSKGKITGIVTETDAYGHTVSFVETNQIDPGTGEFWRYTTAMFEPAKPKFSEVKTSKMEGF